MTARYSSVGRLGGDRRAPLDGEPPPTRMTVTGSIGEQEIDIHAIASTLAELREHRGRRSTRGG